MAVDSTPERSFSDLLSSSRAAAATTGWTFGASGVPRWLVAIMIRSVFSNDCAGSARISVTRVRVLSSSA